MRYAPHDISSSVQAVINSRVAHVHYVPGVFEYSDPLWGNRKSKLNFHRCHSNIIVSVDLLASFIRWLGSLECIPTIVHHAVWLKIPEVHNLDENTLGVSMQVGLLDPFGDSMSAAFLFSNENFRRFEKVGVV